MRAENRCSAQKNIIDQKDKP